MLLKLKTEITQNDDSSSFFFSDVTPFYNSVSYPNGYDLTGINGFNPDDIDTTRLLLDITLPDSSVVNLVIPDTAFDTANIGTTGLITYEIPYSLLGYSSQLSDGIYKFTYTIYSLDGTKSFTRSCYITVLYNICCCLEKKLASLPLCSKCSDKQKKQIDSLWDAYMRKSVVTHLVACHKNTEAQEHIDYLTNYCNIKNCDSCN